MEKLSIVGWTYFDNEYPTKVLTNDNIQDVITLVGTEIAKNRYVFSGEQHQRASTGAPIFSDGTCLRASMRAFGSIMAQVYSRLTGEELGYMDFYMNVGEDVQKLPEESVIDVKPAENGARFGLVIMQDKQIIAESLAMGMEFMTTDVVLKDLYEIYKEQLANQENQEDE